jgi:hypothetical protein
MVMIYGQLLGRFNNATNYLIAITYTVTRARARTHTHTHTHTHCSHFIVINSSLFSIKETKRDKYNLFLVNQRKELLYNIDPLHEPKGQILTNCSFDIRVRAAIRVGDWKLLTGDPGRNIIIIIISFH